MPDVTRRDASAASLWCPQIMTREATMNIAEYAFEFAYLNNRKKVTAVHKVCGSCVLVHDTTAHGPFLSLCFQANIMKRADGLFLESCKSVAKKCPIVQY